MKKLIYALVMVISGTIISTSGSLSYEIKKCYEADSTCQTYLAYQEKQFIHLLVQENINTTLDFEQYIYKRYKDMCTSHPDDHMHLWFHIRGYLRIFLKLICRYNSELIAQNVLKNTPSVAWKDPLIYKKDVNDILRALCWQMRIK